MLDAAYPPDWKRLHLEDVAEIRTGLAKGKKDVQDPIRRPYLRVANVQDGHLDLREVKHITVAATEADRYTLQTGDILLTEGGDADKLGRGTLWRNEVPACLHQNHIFVVRVQRDSLIPDYLVWLTTSPQGREYFRRCSKQSTNLASINTRQLRRYPLVLPEITEQRGIARVLQCADRRIEAAVSLFKARRKMKRGLLQQMLTGHRRFPEGRKQPWRECRLGDVAAECNEPGRGTLGRDRIMGVTKSRGIVPMEDRLIGNVDRYQIVKKDWFAYNPMRLNIGSIARSHSKTPVLVSPDYVVFRCRDGELDPAFLDQYRRGHLWESFMQVCGAGSVRVRIYFNDLGRHKMHLPPIEEQRRIAEALGTLDDELAQLRQLHDALKEQKKGLMQRLLTGKVRVPASLLKEAAHA